MLLVYLLISLRYITYSRSARLRSIEHAVTKLMTTSLIHCSVTSVTVWYFGEHHSCYLASASSWRRALKNFNPLCHTVDPTVIQMDGMYHFKIRITSTFANAKPIMMPGCKTMMCIFTNNANFQVPYWVNCLE